MTDVCGRAVCRCGCEKFTLSEKDLYIRCRLFFFIGHSQQIYRTAPKMYTQFRKLKTCIVIANKLDLFRYHDINTSYLWILQVKDILKILVLSFQILIIKSNCGLGKTGQSIPWVCTHAFSIILLRTTNRVIFCDSQYPLGLVMRQP